MKITLNQLIYALHAKVDGVSESQEVTRICTDTRKLTPGCLFIALKGEQFDGHDYASQALDQGAMAVVVEDPAGLPADKVLVVEDTQMALLKAAGVWRQQLDVKIVAVTGSVGKTTTKEMTYHVLSKKGKTFKTKANLNNEVGLSQMLLSLDKEDEFAVLEIGVDGPGQMLPMAQAAAPNVAIITNVGHTHLEAFGSQQAVQREKLALAQGMDTGGILLLNGDDPLLIGKGRDFYTYYFATRALSAEIQGRNIHVENSQTVFDLCYEAACHRITLPVAGEHNVMNALAAFGAGVVLGVDPQEAANGLEDYQPEGMRQNVHQEKGITFVEDCYNASPQSMRAAMETLAQMAVPEGGRRVVLFGDMLELADMAVASHEEIGRLVAQLKIDALFATGQLAQRTVETAAELGVAKTEFDTDREELATRLAAYLQPGDILWTKASRGMRLEDILEMIYKQM